jgi:DNA-binding NarL/FixJ family response regulator
MRGRDVGVAMADADLSGIEANLSRIEMLLADLLEKVDVLIKVSSIQVGADKSVTERARLLKMAGLDNQTIAEALNTTTGTVRTLTSNLRVRRRQS